MGFRAVGLPVDPAINSWAAVQRTYPPRAPKAPSSQARTQDQEARSQVQAIAQDSPATLTTSVNVAGAVDGDQRRPTWSTAKGLEDV
ncbi:hypothetical protein NW754_008712 [Fusarium falciforme]|uniref:Uncharacterized protein n=1 Tax=Fusarium falciforme TaxID=195108 RepID=A0A9W8V5N4_9HYPO|nr:hypothetical protein NW754_008712 [Fusarium falciforme]KAJ4193618.1 hypothetical protein NW755_003612 [Fusarium falciforme]